MAGDCIRLLGPLDRFQDRASRAFLGLTACAALGLAGQQPDAAPRAGAEVELELDDWAALRADLAAGRLSSAELVALVERLGPEVGANAHAAEVVRTASSQLSALDSSEELDAVLTGLHWSVAVGFAREQVDGMAGTVLRHAQLLRGRGRLGDAEAVLENGIEHLPPDRVDRVYLEQYLARTVFARGEWGRAREYMQRIGRRLAGLEAVGALERAKRSFLPLEHAADQAQMLSEMGLADLATPLLARTIPALDEEYAGGSKVVGKLCQALHTRVSILLGTGRFTSALREVDELLSERAELLAKRPGTRANLLFAAAVASEHLFLVSGATLDEVRSRFARALADEGLKNPSRYDTYLRIARFEALHGDLSRARELLGRADAEPLEVNELSARYRAFRAAVSARVLLAAGASGDELIAARGELRRGFEDLLRERLDEPLRTGGLGVGRYRIYRAVIGDLVELLLAQGDRRAAFDVLLESQRVSSLGRELGAGSCTLEDVREALLDDADGVLVYCTQGEGSHVFALDDRDLLHERIPGRPQLRAESRRLQAAIETRSTDPDAVRTFTDALLPPAIRLRVESWNTVFVVGRDYLDELPFECLMLPDGQWLGVAKALGYLPSVPLGVLWARSFDAARAREYLYDLRLVTDVLDGGAARTPNGPVPGAAELTPFRLGSAQHAALAGPFAPERRDVRVLSAATRAALGIPEPALMLQIVAHGLVDPERERPRGFLLSPVPGLHDGACYSDDIDAFAAAGSPAPLLALLSVCSSASGPMRAGDGEAATLVGAFLRAGAFAVVSTSTEAALDPTVMLMARLHEELAAGVPVAEALRRARQELVRAGYDDPRDFGLIHATGLSNRALFEGRPEPQGSGRSLPVIALACLAALVFGVALVFGRGAARMTRRRE